MASLGLDAYVPGELPSPGTKLPHILTADERSAFFAQVDAYSPSGGEAIRRIAVEYRVLFRLLYCCGLRNSEACGLAARDLDPEGGTLTVLGSKGRRDRLVYMAEDLAALCREYLSWLRGALGCEPEWLFPGRDPARPLPNPTVDRAFERLWGRTEHAASCADKPVPHDLRFSFVTDRVNAWAADDVDVDAMMPYLSRHLGHTSLQSTYHYIHTSERLRDAIARHDVTGPSAIPEADYGCR